MNTLPLNKIKPKNKESLYSFLHRLALINHYEHLGSMFTELESSAYDENCNEIHEELFWVNYVTDFLRNINVDIHDLVVNQFDELLVREEKNSNKGRALYRKYYHRYSTKFCPECMKEDFYHRIHWDIRFVTNCTKHGKELITHCKRCGDFVRLSRLMRNTCRCGKTYTSLNAKESDPISREVQLIVQDFLHGHRKKIMRVDKKWLTQNDYFDFFYLFGLLIMKTDVAKFTLSKSFKYKGELKLTTIDKRKIDMHLLNLTVNTLHYLILDPLSDLASLIDAISENGKGLDYMPKSKSQKYKVLKKAFYHAKGEFYYELYTQHLNDKTDEYINQRFALPPMVKGLKYVPILTAIRILKTEYSTLMNLCHHKLLVLHVTKKDGKKVNLIERESVERYKKMKEDCFTLRQADNYLGLNFNHMKELVDLKLVHPIHGPTVDGYNIWYIPKKEIYRFEKELKGKCQPVPSSKTGLSMRQVSSKLRRDQIHVGGIYQLILSDRLRVFHDGNGRLIDGMKVFEEDVRQLIKDLYYKRIEEKGYLGKEIQRACMAGQDTIKRLLNDGILKIDLSLEIGKLPPKEYIHKEQIVSYLKKDKGMKDCLVEKHLKAVEMAFEPTV